MSAGHDHDHAHAHPEASQARMAGALGVIAAFMAFEVVVALSVHSLALLADAGHMLVDAGALAGAIWAARLAARPPSGSHTYGYIRAEILSAAMNALTLAGAASWVVIEAARRLVHPAAVRGGPVIVVACVGVAANIVATYLLSRAGRGSLNVEGAFRHVLTDLYAFASTVLAGAVVVATGWRRADPAASLVVAALMLIAAVRLLRPAVRVLLEATPETVDLEEVRRHILELPEVTGVHDLHAWMLSSAPVLTAHVVVSDRCMSGPDTARVLDALQGCVAGHFDVDHSTFQLEPEGHTDHEAAGHP